MHSIMDERASDAEECLNASMCTHTNEGRAPTFAATAFNGTGSQRPRTIDTLTPHIESSEQVYIHDVPLPIGSWSYQAAIAGREKTQLRRHRQLKAE